MSTPNLLGFLLELNQPMLERGVYPFDLFSTPFDRALKALEIRNAPIKIESPEHAKMLRGLILFLRVFAFCKYVSIPILLSI
ncbi:hypothetical protein C8R44DRAFT_866706 [Mycena epipterygia]|nr:hypothetical protein C8R44DRAFT_866706 [Mycena epipterygia]